MRYLALLLWLVAGLAHAQSGQGFVMQGASFNPPVQPEGLACTLGPYDSATSTSTICSAISGASDGAVVCLERGETWTQTSTCTITGSHTTRVTVCGSVGDVCADPGVGVAADPEWANSSATNTGIVMPPGTAGFNFRHLHISAPSNSNNGQFGYNIRRGGSHDISIVGGHIELYESPIFIDETQSGQPTQPILDNFEFGTCEFPIEVSGSPSGQSGTRTIWWGICTDCTIAVNAHDFWGVHTGAQDHMIDLGTTLGVHWDAGGANNLTIECGTYTRSASGQMGSRIKLARGMNAIVRDNTFDGSCGNPDLSSDAHAAPQREGWSGAEVYRNFFNHPTCGSSPIFIQTGADWDIYNNISISAGTNTSRGLVQFDRGGDAEDLDVNNIRIFNNTAHRTATAQSVDGYPFISENPGGTPCIGGFPHDMVLANNLFITDKTLTSEPIFTETCGGGCTAWGAGGEDVNKNFLYMSVASSADILTCTNDDSSFSTVDSGDWPISGPTNGADGFATAPGLVDYTNGDYRLSNSSSRLYKNGLGTPGSATCPATDYAGNPQTSPCTVGAYSNIP